MPEHDTYEDARLMTLVAADDKQALCILINRWQLPLSGFVYRYIHDRETTRDLVQETFVRLYEARARYRPEMRFSSWLFKISANLCNNHMRWNRRHPGDRSDRTGPDLTSEEECPIPSGGQTPDQQSVKQDDIRRLEEAVADMPHKLKTTLLLYYYQERSYREIAETLGCSERGVETRLYRARAWLFQKLGSCFDSEERERGPKDSARNSNEVHKPSSTSMQCSGHQFSTVR